MDNFLGKAATAIMVLFLVALFFGFLTMLLWNYLMPDVFGLKEISFWQALAMNILSGILFSNKSSSSSKD